MLIPWTAATVLVDGNQRELSSLGLGAEGEGIMNVAEHVDRQASITVGIVGLAVLIAVFFAGVLDWPLAGYVASLWDRGAVWLFDVSRLSVLVPSCPAPGGSWWFQGTLLCTTPYVP